MPLGRIQTFNTSVADVPHSKTPKRSLDRLTKDESCSEKAGGTTRLSDFSCAESRHFLAF